MDQQFKVKVTHDDLKRMGIVRSRYDQFQKIRAGKLRPPNKDAARMQAAAWWWWEDVLADLERERAQQQQTSSQKEAS